MPRKPLLRQRMEEWIEDCEERLLSTQTIQTYRKSLEDFYRFARESGIPLHPAKITPRHIREYYEELMDLSTATQKLRMTVLKLFLQSHGKIDWSKVNLRITVTRTRVNWLSEDQVSLLIASAHHPRHKAALVIMAYTGVRVGELVRLRWKDMRERSVQVRGKGGKSRTIPVDSEFWSELLSYLAYRQTLPDHDRFLLHDCGPGAVSPWSEGTVHGFVRHLGEELGMYVTPHTLRRSFGRHLYMRGCPLAQLSMLMGHASIEQTVSYLGIGDEDIQQAMMRYRPSYREKREEMYLKRTVQ